MPPFLPGAFRLFVAAVAAATLLGCASNRTELVTIAETSAPLHVYAAGSLREAFTRIAAQYQAQTGQVLALTFGASGLLRERIEKGEAAQVFASADTEHPERLAAQGLWQNPQVFTRNSLCAITREGLSVTPQTLLQNLLSQQVRVGTSTPKSDPSGDYTWALFGKAEALQKGAFAVLDQKALKLTGAADSPRPPAGKNAYAWLMGQGKADLFLTYCTNAVAAQKELPSLSVVQVPAQLQVGAAYGLTLARNSPLAAQRFAKALLEPQAQSVLQSLGFGAP
jgi:molybdate transport system substrate-binding protein